MWLDAVVGLADDAGTLECTANDLYKLLEGGVLTLPESVSSRPGSVISLGTNFPNVAHYALPQVPNITFSYLQSRLGVFKI